MNNSNLLLFKHLLGTCGVDFALNDKEVEEIEAKKRLRKHVKTEGEVKMKKNKKINPEIFIDELKKELLNFADAWRDEANKCKKTSNDWTSCATTSGVLYSLSKAMELAIDSTKQIVKR
jgi:hypothetical protein